MIYLVELVYIVLIKGDFKVLFILILISLWYIIGKVEINVEKISVDKRWLKDNYIDGLWFRFRVNLNIDEM